MRDHVARDSPAYADLGPSREVGAGTRRSVRRARRAGHLGDGGPAFASARDELEPFLPERRPRYAQPELDPYAEPIGADEEADPEHLAGSLVRRLAATPARRSARTPSPTSTASRTARTRPTSGPTSPPPRPSPAATGCRSPAWSCPATSGTPRYAGAVLDSGFDCIRGPQPSWGHQRTRRTRSTGRSTGPPDWLDTYAGLSPPPTTSWDAVRGARRPLRRAGQRLPAALLPAAGPRSSRSSCAAWSPGCATPPGDGASSTSGGTPTTSPGTPTRASRSCGASSTSSTGWPPQKACARSPCGTWRRPSTARSTRPRGHSAGPGQGHGTGTPVGWEEDRAWTEPADSPSASPSPRCSSWSQIGLRDRGPLDRPAGRRRPQPRRRRRAGALAGGGAVGPPAPERGPVLRQPPGNHPGRAGQRRAHRRGHRADRDRQRPPARPPRDVRAGLVVVVASLGAGRQRAGRPVPPGPAPTTSTCGRPCCTWPATPWPRWPCSWRAAVLLLRPVRHLARPGLGPGGGRDHRGPGLPGCSAPASPSSSSRHPPISTSPSSPRHGRGPRRGRGPRPPCLEPLQRDAGALRPHGPDRSPDPRGGPVGRATGSSAAIAGPFGIAHSTLELECERCNDAADDPCRMEAAAQAVVAHRHH